MREVTKIEYETIIESDLSEYRIYAFSDNEGNIAFLSRKNDKFFWKDLRCVNHVWYEMYDTIEDAVEKVLKVREYEKNECSSILEFQGLQDFLEWAIKQQ